MTDVRSVIVGTAGHIDHGKSALVRALTGIDPDRLEEEQRRGMTIDLGFARYEHPGGGLVGIIDVPGHERFIRNMVAGATSVDVVVLVVAADDGVMPQTREHLAILKLLGVERGCVALTKSDLVEPEMLELAADDVASFVAGTFLEGRPIVPVSAIKGDGMEAFRAVLDALVDEVPPRASSGPFRLPVQRVFSAKGHGTVVTGVPVSGAVTAGDGLEVVDTGARVRVRGVQAYGAARDAGQAGHSTALNVSDVSTDDVERGCVVATPGLFRPRRRLLVSYRHVDGTAPLRNSHPIRLHVGTREVMGRAVVLDGEAVLPDDEAYLQLRLEQPVVVATADRFVMRDAASMVVLGGGAVLATSDGRLKRFKQRVLTEAQRRRQVQGDPRALAHLCVELAGRRGATLAAVAVELARRPDEVAALLAGLVEAGTLVAVGAETFLDAGALETVADTVVDRLEAEHAAQPLLTWIDIGSVRGGVEVEEAVLQAAIERDPRVDSQPGGKLRLARHVVELSDEQRRAREGLQQRLAAAGQDPVEVDPGSLGLTAAQGKELLRMMIEGREAVSVGGRLYDPEALDALRRIVIAHGSAREGAIDIPVLRDELATTRKFLIPLLEHFDTCGVTVRRGDRRVLRPGVTPD